MKTQKQHRNDKLQKSSVLFLQLGLVLALFVTYALLEFESIKSDIPDFTVENTEDPEIAIVPDRIFTIERTKSKSEQPQATIIDVIDIIDDHEPIITNVIPTVDQDDIVPIDDLINKLPGNDVQPVEPPVDDIIFEKIEDAPIFPGCENLDQKASKQCFADKISKFVNKKFNTDIAEGLNGKQRIWVQFIVDKTGTVTDIRARSPYKNLEKEAIRVIEKLPQMTPGKQRKRAVNVKYRLPIVFQTY